MNHFISGILKIILLEGSIALLIIDAIAGERFEKVRARAHGVLAGLMVLAWCNYGAIRWDASVGTVLTSFPLVIFCGWLIGFAFDPKKEERLGTRKVPPVILKHAKALSVAVVVLASGAWVSVGVSNDKLPLIHQWEQYHFYLGAKYQREVGWFNLYKATVLADRESVNLLAGMATTRDLTNFQEVKLDDALVDAPAVRARFTDERWAEFKADWVAMARLWPNINWSQIMNDHGNSNSPAWAIFAAPLAKLVPITAHGQAFLGWLDMLLMLGLWLVVWQTFGHRVASVGLFIFAAPPIVFDYLTGSLLRWDWLFAIGLAACFVKQKRFGWAGGFFGFAVATKLFPLFFGVALGVRALFVWRETKKFKPEYLRFGIASAVAGGAAVLISTGLFGVDAWKDYAKRIEVAQVEKFYAIQYSFKAVWLQHVASPMRDWGFTIFPSDLKQRSPAVEVCGGSADRSDGNGCHVELNRCGDGRTFAMDCVGADCTCSNGTRFSEPDACGHRGAIFNTGCGFPTDYSFSLLIGRVLFSLLIIALIRRAEDVEAFLLGPLLVFTWLTVNMYYWNMLGLLAMGLLLRSDRPNQRPALGLLIGFHVSFMLYYLYQHLNRGLTEGYAVAWCFTVAIIGTAIWEWQTTKRELSASASSPPAR